MSRDNGAIVAKADPMGEIQDAKAAWGRLDTMEHQARQLPAERLAMGRRLVNLRRFWPARGPNAKGWGETLAKIGIPERSAREYMDLAAHVDQANGSTEFTEPAPKPDSTLTEPETFPTRAEVREAKADKKAKIDGAKQTHEHPPAKTEQPAVDAPTPQPVASEKHAPKAPAEIVAGRGVDLQGYEDAKTPPDRLRLAAALLDLGDKAKALRVIALALAELQGVETVAA